MTGLFVILLILMNSYLFLFNTRIVLTIKKKAPLQNDEITSIPLPK